MERSIRTAVPALLGLTGLSALVLVTLAASQSQAGADTGSRAHQSASITLRNGNGGCANGNVCVWNQNNYSNCWNDMNQDKNDYGNIAYQNCGSLLLNNTVNSVKNRGDCNVRMFAGTNRSGDQITFSRRSAPGGTINDPMLSNGGGASGNTNQNWANRISSHNFCV